jgi:hypothetical protein
MLAAIEDYRTEVAAATGASGRVVWHWNIDTSFRWAQAETQIVNRGLPAAEESWPGLAPLFRVIARGGDIVSSGAFPITGSYDLLAGQGGLGAGLPQVLYATLEQDGGLPPPGRAGDLFLPFGSDEGSVGLALSRGMKLGVAPAAVAKRCNSKVVAKRFCLDSGTPTPEGAICGSAEEAERTAASLFRRFDTVVLKDSWGSSGKGITLLESPDRLRRLLRGVGAWPATGVVVEGWYPHLRSENCQYLLLPSGRVRYLGRTRQLLEKQKYRGNVIAADWREPPAPAVHDGQLALLRYLLQLGYFGFVGIDTLETPDGAVFPIIEVNARLNLSTFALALLERTGHAGAASMTLDSVRTDKRLDGPAEIERLAGELVKDGCGCAGVVPMAMSTSASGSRTVRLVTMCLADDEPGLAAARGRWAERLAAFAGGQAAAGGHHAH